MENRSLSALIRSRTTFIPMKEPVYRIKLYMSESDAMCAKLRKQGEDKLAWEIEWAASGEVDSNSGAWIKVMRINQAGYDRLLKVL